MEEVHFHQVNDNMNGVGYMLYFHHQEVSEAVAEVLGHVLGSYRPGVGAGVGLRLYLKLTQEVARLMVADDNTWTPLEAAVMAFRYVLCLTVPGTSSHLVW